MKEEVRQKVMERFSISEQAMRLLLESAEMMSFVPKDIIVHEGEINTNMYILSKGIWRAYTFKDGTEDTFWFAVESEIALPVGGYTSGSPSLYTIEAVTASEEIIQSVPLKYIASYLGVTAQSLSRIRAKLASSLTFIV